MNSIFWHDYETFGGDPRRDRACQFAGIRTDEDLNIIDDPVEIYCQPAPDFLPDPYSCAITGISPQKALAAGVSEADFCARIASELSAPGTCTAGYNSIRFDDEVTRQMFYRNFYDPYEREWKNGNSRWDIIDLLRMTHALRPEGIVWPTQEDGSPSFRLQELTRVNGIEHENAHDALADVHATIAMARLVKQKQPKLYEFVYNLRSKHRVLPLLDLGKQEPVIHASRMFAAQRGCLAIVLPIIQHPRNTNGIVVADLLSDPGLWMDLSADEIRTRLYTRTDQLAEGQARIPLKTIHINRCPAVAPITVLTDVVKNLYALDMDAVYRHRQRLLADKSFARKIIEVFDEVRADDQQPDPDLMLYSGGFFDQHDKRMIDKVRTVRPEQLTMFNAQFHDKRLAEMLFRYRARNFPQTLTAEEQQRWKEFCRKRLLGEIPGAGVSREMFDANLLAAESGMPAALVIELRSYAANLYQQLQLA
ncbi:MAG: exodeoxyribonuclease I [Pseudomonadota bacterium]